MSNPNHLGMFKILFIIDDLGRGGAEKITAEFANFLSQSGHHVTVAIMNSHNKSQQLNPNIDFIDLNIRKEISFGKLWKYKKLTPSELTNIDQKINKNPYDLIILGHHNGYYLYEALEQKENTWLWIHAELLEFRPVKNPIKRLKEVIRQIRNRRKFKALFKDKKCITVNADLAHRYSLLENSAQFTSIANGVSPSILSDTPIEKKWDTIFVGRLVAIKQVDHAIRAFVQSGLTGKMAIIGDGPEKQQLEHLVVTLNYSDRIEFLGWQENPITYMQQSHSLIMSSYYEGSPVTLVEAISVNVPVVSYNSSQGIEDIFTDEFKSHCLVEKQNISALAIRLQKTVSHPFVYDQSIQNQISMQRMANQFLKLIK